MPAKKKAPQRGAKSRPKKPAPIFRDVVVGLLHRKGGASLEDLMKATGWQAPSVRGFISVLQSKHGYKIKSKRVEGVRRYSI
jgi:hypothetical protein